MEETLNLEMAKADIQSIVSNSEVIYEYSDNFVNKVICGDSLSVMKKMPDKSIDLVVTSPPYNLKNSTGNGMKANTTSGKWAGNALQNGYSHYNDNIPNDEYAQWQYNCLKEMYRLIKDDGAIFYNHKT